MIHPPTSRALRVSTRSHPPTFTPLSHSTSIETARARACANPEPDTPAMDQHARPRRPQTSRPKPLPPGDEDVSTDVILGEFQDVDTLTLSEASLVINALVAKRRNDRKGFQETEILAQTVDYLDAFARFKQKENVEAVERLLSSHKNLNKFERAQIGMELTGFLIRGRRGGERPWRVDMCADAVFNYLGSLCCDSAEEAKTLIPSIANKIDDDVLQDLLDQMAKLQG